MTKQEQIDALRTALYTLSTGKVKQVQLGSRTVTYFDMSALRAELKAMEAEQDADAATALGALPGVTVAMFDRR